MSDLALETRDGLPDALRILLTDYPRESWAHDPGFEGMVRFWLDRHMMFRQLLARLQTGTARFLDDDLEAAGYLRDLAQLGNTFVGELHAHHSIEDHHYFPKLVASEPRLARGFEMLDADHHALDTRLGAFVAGANGVLQGEGADMKAAVGAVSGELSGLARFLDRHLTDEEELVVPIVLRYGNPQV